MLIRALPLVSLLLVGCAELDVEMRNPVLVNAVDPNRVARTHAYIERERGLPPNSVMDEASLISVDANGVCFGVTLHELDPLDLNTVEARLSAPHVDTVEGPQVSAEQPVFSTYQGRIPERRQTGMETYCSYRDSHGNCLSWRTRPLYATFYIPGPVSVYQARGTLCFPNRNLVGPTTERVTLALKLRRQPTQVGGWVGSKELVWRWGFIGAQKR
jgi:hypothetical protein